MTPVAVILLFLLVPTLAFAESQTVSTDGGILDLKITHDDEILPNSDSIITIEFINPTTDKIQLHIDYDIKMTQNDTIIATLPLIHSSEGIVRGLKVPFPTAGEYNLVIGVEGILFQPIEREVASFIIPVGIASAQTAENEGGGCLIATAAYGSEMAPQIQRLREIRDELVLPTDSGRWFVSTFNQVYYVFSPTIADMERENPIVKNAVLFAIQPMIISLNLMEYAGSELEVMTYGMLVILFNVGIYVIGPVLGLTLLLRTKTRRRIISRITNYSKKTDKHHNYKN